MPDISKKSMKKFAKSLLGASYAPPKAKVTDGRMIEFIFLHAPQGSVILNDKMYFRKHNDCTIVGMRVAVPSSGEVLPVAYTFNLVKGTCKMFFDSHRCDLTTEWSEYLVAQAIGGITVDRESGM